MKLTIKQIVDMHEALDKMSKAGIFVKGLKNIDLAMNKATLEPIVEGYKTAVEYPKEYMEYLNEVNDLKLKTVNADGKIDDPKKASEKLLELNETYKETIKFVNGEYNETVKKLLTEEKNVKLITLKRDDFNFKDETTEAINVMYGLIPIIKDE